MDELDKKKIEWIKFGLENYGLYKYNYDLNVQQLEVSYRHQRMSPRVFEYPKFIIVLNTEDELVFKPSCEESYTTIVSLINKHVIKF